MRSIVSFCDTLFSFAVKAKLFSEWNKTFSSKGEWEFNGTNSHHANFKNSQYLSLCMNVKENELESTKWRQLIIFTNFILKVDPTPFCFGLSQTDS